MMNREASDFSDYTNSLNLCVLITSNINEAVMQKSTSSTQQPRSTSYSHATVQRKARSVTSKIRDSCHSCAVSKVRCPKERPTCSRCSKRGTICEYFATKRPGRKRENRSVTEAAKNCDPTEGTDSILRDKSPAGLSTSEPSSLHSLNLSPSLGESRNVSGTVEYSSYIDVLAELIPPLEQTPSPRISRLCNNFGNNFDRSLTPTEGILDLGQINSQWTNLPPGTYDIEGLLTSTESSTCRSIENPPISHTLPFKYPFPDFEELHFSLRDQNKDLKSKGSDPWPTCHCIVQALSTMYRLFVPESPFSASMSASPSDPATISISSTSYGIAHCTARDLVTQNKNFIEVVDGILRCPVCIENSHIMAILFIIVSKILERYTIAARQDTECLASEYSGNSTSNSQGKNQDTEHIANFSTYSCSHDDDHRWSTSRLILGELHRVQGLMNRLSQRYDSRMDDGAPHFERNSPDFPSAGSKIPDPDVAFSNTTLHEMKSDLRKSLSSLSSGIINMLRES